MSQVPRQPLIAKPSGSGGQGHIWRYLVDLHGSLVRTLTKIADAINELHAKHDIATTTGATTIPTTPHTEFLLLLGGDHDLEFNGTTLDVSGAGWGTGDILHVFVQSTTVCFVWREVAAADLGVFA